MNKIYTFLLFFLMAQVTIGQTLKSKLEDKVNYKEICQIAEQHFAELNRNNQSRMHGDPKEKHFRRWEWYMRNRLDNNGNIFDHNTATRKAFQKFDFQNKSWSNSRNVNSDWNFTGPSIIPTNPTSTNSIGNGRVDRIAFHSTNPNIIFAGTPSGGLWKTTNGGSSWFPLDKFLPTQGISGIVVDDDNNVYVVNGTGDANGNYANKATGVYKSTDGGFNWEYKPFGFSLRVYAMVKHPVFNMLYVAAETGLYFSPDDGDSWSNKYQEQMTDVYVQPVSPYRVHACGNEKVIHTTSNIYMVNEVNFSGGTPLTGRKSFATSIDNPEVIYLHTTSVSDTIDGNFSGFFKSTNNGANYALVTNAPNISATEPGDGVSKQSAYNHCATASPNDYKKVIVGGLIIWRNYDEGNFNAWENSTSYGFNDSGVPIAEYVHPDVHALEYNALNGWLYAGTDGGIYRSQDDGLTWLNITNGISTTQFFSIAVCPSNPNLIIGGSQDNGAKYKNSSSNIWDHYGGGDAYITAYDPNDVDKYYYVIHGTISQRDGGLVYDVTPPNVQVTTHSQIETHPTLSDVVFVGTRSDTICLSGTPTDPSSWVYRSLKSDLCIATTAANLSTVYAAGGWYSDPEVNVSTNTGLNWTRIDTNGLPDFIETTKIPTDISVSPINSQRLVVSISGYFAGEKVFHSINGGNSWTNISLNLPNVPIHCLAYLSNGGILAGTELGVFYKMNGDSNWIPFSNNLPIVHVSEMVLNELQGLVTISTYGRGTFQSPLPDAFCDNQIIWPAPTAIQGQQFFSANQLIETRSVVDNGGAGTQIFFQSGDRIILKEGFHARTNTSGKVKAYIAPCGSEIPEGY